MAIIIVEHLGIHLTLKFESTHRLEGFMKVKNNAIRLFAFPDQWL